MGLQGLHSIETQNGDTEKTEYKGHYVVFGPPGCGKTTFLCNQVRKLVKEGLQPLVCSLTKTAAREVAGRDVPVDPQSIGTLHSLAYRTIGRAQKLAEVAEWNSEFPHYAMSGNFSSREKSSDDIMPTQGTKVAGDGLFGRLELLRHQMRPKELWPSTVREFSDAWEDWKYECDYCDFTDMIEDATRWSDGAIGDPDVIVVDEMQDFSRLEYALLDKWSQATRALITVGDPYQSLYTWRGAAPEIFFDPSVDANHRKILSQSYRVPRAVQQCAVKWVSTLSDYQAVEYKPRDVEGEVNILQRGTRLAPGNIITAAKDELGDGKSVMILASCEYMLSPLVRAMREQGIPFANPWRPSHGGWNPMGNRRGVTMLSRITSLLAMLERPWTVRELVEWSSILTASELFVRGGKKKLQSVVAEETVALDAPWVSVAEFIDTDKLIPLGQMLQRRDTKAALEWWLPRITSSKLKPAIYPVSVAEQWGVEALKQTPRLYVGTIHSFKGGEADVVFLLPDLPPIAYAQWQKGKKHADPIIRAFYVALTRAREKLYICQPAGEMTVTIGV